MPTRAVGLLAVVLAAWLSWAAVAAAQETPQALAEKLTDPLQREEATRQLVAMGAKALPALQEVLQSKRTDDAVRREVLKVLPQFGEKGVALLIAALKDSSLELEACKQLASLGPGKAVETAMSDLVDRSLDPRVRLAAMEWLSENGDAARFDGKLLGLLGDPSDKVRLRAAEMIAARKGAAALPDLMDLLRQAELAKSAANRNQRVAIITALGLIGQKGPNEVGRVLPALVQALGEPDEQEAAVEALTRIGAPAVPGLLMVLKAGDTNRAAAAMDVLLSIGSKAAPEVVSLLQAKHPKMRRMAKQFLCMYHDPAVFPLLRDLYPKVEAEEKQSILTIASLYDTPETLEFLIAAAGDESAAVRMTAVELLGRSGKKGAVPVLLARAEEDSDMDIRIAAVRGLFALGDLAVVPSLARLVEYEKWQVRVELLQALAFMGTASEVKGVADQLRHRKSEVAGAAARALADMTYLSGQRSPDEWESEVKEVLEGGEGEERADLTTKTVWAGEDQVEVAVLGSGDPVMMVLLPSVAPAFKYTPAYLSVLARHYRVVVVPFTGCPQGGVDRPGLYDCMKRYAETLAVVKEELAHGKVTLVAHSFTGFAAILYASLHPESVDRLVLGNPVFPRRYYVELTADRAMAALPARWKKELEFLEAHSGELLPAAAGLYRSRVELASEVRAEGAGMLVAQGYYGLKRLLDETYFPYEETGIVSALANVRAPVLLVFGKDDFALEENREAFRILGQMNRNVVVGVVDGSVRFTMVEQARTFQQVVHRFQRDFSVESAVAGVGGQVSSAKVAFGEIGEFTVVAAGEGGGESVAVAGEKVESSRLTQFLSNLSPEEGGDGKAQAGDVQGEQRGSQGEQPGGGEGGVAKQGEQGRAPEKATGPPPGGGRIEIGTVETERGRSATWDYVGWGLVGFGAAALLSGGYLHYEAFDRAIAADDLDPLAPDYESRFDRTYSEATDYQMYAYIAYGVAALAAFAGLDVLFSWPIAVGQAEDAGYAPVPIVPMVLSDGAGMCVQFELP